MRTVHGDSMTLYQRLQLHATVHGHASIVGVVMASVDGEAKRAADDVTVTVGRRIQRHVDGRRRRRLRDFNV